MKMPVGNRTDSVSAAVAENDHKGLASNSKANAAAPNGNGSSHNGDVPSWNGPQQAGGVTALNGDPFVYGAAGNGAKLRGKAVSFSPVPSSGPAGQISYLNGLSEAITEPVIVSSTPLKRSVTRTNGHSNAVQQPVGTRVEHTTPKRAKIVFSTDVGPNITVPGGHYMKLEYLPASEADATLKTLCEDMGWKKKLIGYVAPPSANGKFITVWLYFDDMRDAANAIEQVQHVNPKCAISYIPQTEYACGTKAAEGHGIQEVTSFYDGQVMLLAKYGRGEDQDAEGLYDYVRGTAKQFGPIVGVNEKIISGGVRHYHIEFYKISDAKFMAESVRDTDAGQFKYWKVTAMEIPDSTPGMPVHGVAANGNSMQTQFASPTGRTAWTFDKKGNMVAVTGERQLPKCLSIKAGVNLTPVPYHMRNGDQSPQTPIPGITYGPANASHQSSYVPSKSPHHKKRMPDNGPNRIDIERIQGGIDVRTTVMVRNIPNEMTVEQFKTVLDKVSFGRYNFVYLRFDFTKNTNVGYAFVNFLTPGDILVFFNAYNGQEYVAGMGFHPRYGPRLGEMAYATVQGDDCSVEKFRNSAVMCEYPGFRPKLFWTVNDAPTDAFIGKERPFPEPNNDSKHKRSKDNAAQIGLYAPKHHRQGNVTPRASQYDRGTTAQMQEDAYFQHQQMVQHSMGYGYVDSYGAHHQVPLPIGAATPPYPIYYGPSNPFWHGGVNGTPGTPNGYSPSPSVYYSARGPAAFNGSPGPMMGHRGTPSRLPTIAEGPVGNGARRPAIVRPPRDYDTAIREIEENKRVQAEYDAVVAALDAEEAAAAQAGNAVDVPRAMNGEGPITNHSVYYDANDATGGIYTNGAYQYTYQ